MATYYPAPYGSYRKFVAAGDTWLARDTGAVLVGGQKPANLPGTMKLYVNGSIVVGNTPDKYPGALRWDGTNFKGCCKNNDWFDLIQPATHSPGEVAIISGTNPSCPSGSSPDSYYWTAKSGSCHYVACSYAGGTTADYYPSCTTAAGWSKSRPSCGLANCGAFTSCNYPDTTPFARPGTARPSPPTLIPRYNAYINYSPWLHSHPTFSPATAYFTAGHTHLVALTL